MIYDSCKAIESPEVSILIVAYHSNAFIEKCISSIPNACKHNRYEILLIDNGDGSTAALVAERFCGVRLLSGKGNVGFAKANNLLASEASADKILLINPDVVLEPGAIDALLAGAISKPHAAAWGGLTLDADGFPDSGNSIAVPSLLELASTALGCSLVGRKPVKGAIYDEKVDVLSGSFVMFSRDSWEIAQGLDERYFLYCEEVDLFHRLGKAGFVFFRIAGAKCFHNVGHGSGTSPVRLLYRAAGTMQFLRLHTHQVTRSLGGFLIWVAALERFLVGKLFGSFSGRLQQLGEGYRYVALNPRCWVFGYDSEKGLLAEISNLSGLSR